MSTQNKYFHKTITLSIKALIFLLSIIYIWQRLTSEKYNINFNELNRNANINYLIIAGFLMLVNWSLEAIKWKILISKFENISFLSALQAVFSGVTVSIFTPNRVGEFAGKVFFLKTANKIQASLSSIIGGMFQLLVTVLMGFGAYFILEYYYEDYFSTKHLINNTGILILLIVLFLVVTALVFVYKKRNKQFSKIKKYIEVLTSYSFTELSSIFFLSLIRYGIFSTQYFLLLRFFGINAGTIILFSLIALTFFVTSAIPTFALSEIAVRGATAVYFFSPLFPNPSLIIEVSILLWIINLAIPALVGAIFIWKLKFFKE